MSYLQHSEIDFHDDHLDLSCIMIDLEVHDESLVNFYSNTTEENFDFNTGQFAMSPQQISIPYEVPIEIENDKEEKFEKENFEDENSEKENMEDENSEDDEIQKNKIKMIKKYSHVQGKRRPKGKKNRYQTEVGGYWTKNFLPFGKNYHFDWIEKKVGPNFLKNHEELKQIKEKLGINLSDFVALYKCEELKEIWEEFFAKKVLYRDLMLSRTKTEYRVIYVQFLHVFERAFKTKIFEGISRISWGSEDKMSNKAHEEFNRAEFA